jgi:hypothetical protein
MLTALALFVFGSAEALAQMTPQQIQQRQEVEEKILQREAQEQAQQQSLTAQQRQAQTEDERQIDRLRTEQQRQAQAVAEQQLLYLLQQAERRQSAEQGRRAQPAEQPWTGPEPGAESGRAARTPEQETSPSATRWSYKNMSDLDKAGLAVLGALLGVLAFGADIVPARLTPKWARRVLIPDAAMGSGSGSSSRS